MSESPRYSGLERLNIREIQEYEELRKEVIEMAIFWKKSHQQPPEDLNSFIPENRRRRLSFLVNQSRLSFIELDLGFRRAIHILGLGRELYPGVTLPDESSTQEDTLGYYPRPPVVESDISHPLELSAKKRRMDLMITTVREMQKSFVEPTPRLVALCKDLVFTSEKFGGLQKYTQDPEFSRYVSTVATAVNVKSGAPVRDFPPPQVSSPQAMDTTPSVQEVDAQIPERRGWKIISRLKNFFWEKSK